MSEARKREKGKGFRAADVVLDLDLDGHTYTWEGTVVRLNK